MDQLIEQITQRTGISMDQARGAVQTVMGFLKDKLPGPVASQVEGVLSSGGNMSGGMADQARQTMGDVGDVFGQNRE